MCSFPTEFNVTLRTANRLSIFRKTASVLGTQFRCSVNGAVLDINGGTYATAKYHRQRRMYIVA